MSMPTAHGAVERLRQSRAVADREDHGRPMPERRRRPDPLHAIPISPKTCIKSPIQRPCHPLAPAPQLYSPSASVASRLAGVQTPSSLHAIPISRKTCTKSRPAPAPPIALAPLLCSSSASTALCSKQRRGAPCTGLSSAGSASAASCPKQR